MITVEYTPNPTRIVKAPILSLGVEGLRFRLPKQYLKGQGT